jgi:hypothetical protein
MESFRLKLEQLVIQTLMILAGVGIVFWSLQGTHFRTWFPYSLFIWFAAGPLIGCGLFNPFKNLIPGVVFGLIIQVLVSVPIVLRTLSEIGKIQG